MTFARPLQSLFLLCAMLPALCAKASGPVAVITWDVETSRLASYTLDALRGETVNLEPHFTSYKASMDLSTVTNVDFCYRDATMASGTYHSVTGSILVATGGTVRVQWTPEADTGASSYTYTLALRSELGATLRSYGTLRITTSVTGIATNRPATLESVDWESALTNTTPTGLAGSVPVVTWNVETAILKAYPIDLLRGETVYLQPRLLNYSQPMSLLDVSQVILRYRHSGLATGFYYTATGLVISPTNGEMRIAWTPGCDDNAASYDYTIAVKSAAGDDLRGYGTFRMLSSVVGATTNVPVIAGTIDWSTIDNSNLGDAPFELKEGVGGGVVATWASNHVISLEGLTNGWNLGSAQATFASNLSLAISGSTSRWNTASIDATAATNWLATNSLGLVSARASWASNSAVGLQALTSGWNTASADATSATNWLATNSLGLVSTRANWASNSAVSLQGLTSGWNLGSAQGAFASNLSLAISGSTSRWNTAAVDATAATNWLATNSLGLVSARASWGSNGVVTLNVLTTRWNTASTDATSATNWLSTNSLGLVSARASWASNSAVSLQALTSGWNLGSAQGAFASNLSLAISGSTSRWNTASIDATAATNWLATNSLGLVSARASWASNSAVTLQGLTSGWNTASARATYASNLAASISGTTSRWNTAAIDATSATNWLATNRLTAVSTWASNSAVTLQGLTSGWNTASARATYASNLSLAISGSTSRWNTASTDATSATNWLVTNRLTAVSTWASNSAVTLQGLTSGWNTASARATYASNLSLAISGSTSRWNTASVNATAATNWLGTNTLAALATWASNTAAYASNNVGDAAAPNYVVVSNAAVYASNLWDIAGGSTSAWNTAAIDATSATNWLSTNTLAALAAWASNTAVYASNNIGSGSAPNYVVVSNAAVYASNLWDVAAGSTSRWNTASTDATAATNWLATNSLGQVSAWATWCSNLWVVANPSTSSWNVARTDSTAATNWIATNTLASRISSIEGGTNANVTTATNLAYNAAKGLTNGLVTASITNGCLTNSSWVGTATSPLDMGGNAVSNIGSGSAFSSGYLVGPSLSADTTFTFAPTQTIDQINAIIAAIPANLNKKTLYLKFESGTYTNATATPLTINAFYAGVVNVQWTNTYSTVGTNQPVVIDMSAKNSACVSLANNLAQVNVTGFKMVPNSTGGYAGFVCNSCVSVKAEYCSVMGNGNSNGHGFLNSQGTLYILRSVVGSVQIFTFTQSGNYLTTIQLSYATNTTPAYGAYALIGTVLRADANVLGTTDTLLGTGGLIVNSGGKVLP